MSVREPISLMCRTDSPQQTIELGRRIAGELRIGDVVALVGELGVGKTQFVKGLAEGLGADPRLVSSPTFVLMCEYPAPAPIVHIDAYRLEGLSDLESIGWSPQLLAASITVVEWADRIEAQLPADHLRLDFSHEAGGGRSIQITPLGDVQRRIESIRTILLPDPQMSVKCPTCGRPASDSTSDFPFCSNRCRLVDLNRWFGGEYRVSRSIHESDLAGETE